MWQRAIKQGDNKAVQSSSTNPQGCNQFSKKQTSNTPLKQSVQPSSETRKLEASQAFNNLQCNQVNTATTNQPNINVSVVL
jgi:hypothetical protein